MADTAELPLQTYRGNCHCGAFVYEAQLPEIKVAYECNCSICYKKAYLWNFAGPGGIKIVKGDDNTLKSYTFNAGNTIHKVNSAHVEYVGAGSTDTLPVLSPLRLTSHGSST
jgi:hypothetical protein